MKHTSSVKTLFTMVLLLTTTFYFSCKGDQPDEETLLLYSRAAAAYAQGDFGETVSMLDGVDQRPGLFRSPGLWNFSPALVLRAKALYFDGRGADAEELLRRALQNNPGSGEASLFLARVLREQDREEEARELAEAVLRDDPQDIRALRLAADLAAQRDDTEAAAALLDRAAEAAAEAALVFVDRAKLKWTMGNGSGALEDLRRAEILLPWNTALGRGIGSLRNVIAGEIDQKEETHEN
jgi:tetratricopeptide (TPR) repeat protein